MSNNKVTKNITVAFGIVMKRYGVSSNDLAKKLGISNRGVNKAIGKDAIKKIDTIEKYCNAIGCSVDELCDEAKRIGTNSSIDRSKLPLQTDIENMLINRSFTPELRKETLKLLSKVKGSK